MCGGCLFVCMRGMERGNRENELEGAGRRKQCGRLRTEDDNLRLIISSCE